MNTIALLVVLLSLSSGRLVECDFSISTVALYYPSQTLLITDADACRVERVFANGFE